MALESDGSTENGNEETDVRETLGNRAIPGYIKHLLAQGFIGFKSKHPSFRDFYHKHLTVCSPRASGLFTVARRYRSKQRNASL